MMITFLQKTFAFVRRDAIESLSYRTSVVMQTLSILAHILTFFFIAKLINPSISANSASPLHAYGGDYFSFVLVGLALSRYQTAGMLSFSSAIVREQEAGTLEAILMTPTKLHTVIFAGSLWSILSTSLYFMLYLAVGSIFFKADLSSMNMVTILVTIFLTLSSLAGLGIFSAGLILIVKRGDPVQFFFNGISKFLGGVYFPIAILPDGFQMISKCIPLTYALEAMRKSVLNGASLGQIQQEATILILFSLVLIPAGLGFFGWAVQKAKKEGSLTFY